MRIGILCLATGENLEPSVVDHSELPFDLNGSGTEITPLYGEMEASQ